MFPIAIILWTIFFLAGTFVLTALSTSLRRIYKKDANRQLKSLGRLFFYRSFHYWFFPSQEYEGLFFSTICAQNVTRLCYAGGMLAFLLQTQLFSQVVGAPEAFPASVLTWMFFILSIIACILTSFVFGDYFPRILGTRLPEFALRFCAPLASIFLLLVFPLSFLFLKIGKSMSRIAYLDPSYEPMGKEEIMDMIQRADFSPTFDLHDKKLIESVVLFKERIVREVMVPRVDVFSLSADTTIKDAAKLLESEGYSRTPIYRNTVDNIVGVLMYKDILSKYMEYELKGHDQKVLLAPIESIQKSVLHVPETKKISSLLQEFRKKQVHLAIVVDEYGGTEGIVTIEDILEEIVGEIADEYDLEQELFYSQPDGSWVVDARMSILDVEEELGLKILQEGEFDTIGGYIFHTAGTIPPKGFVIHHDDFEMEILLSNDRCVEKVRIKPAFINKSTE